MQNKETLLTEAENMVDNFIGGTTISENTKEKYKKIIMENINLILELDPSINPTISVEENTSVMSKLHTSVAIHKIDMTATVSLSIKIVIIDHPRKFKCHKLIDISD